MSRPRPAITRRRALLGGAALVTYLSLGEGVAKAAGLTITAELERARVSVGEGVRFAIEIVQEGSGGNLPAPKIPDFTAMGMTVQGPGVNQGSSTMWVNGQVTRRTTVQYSYLLIPGKPGTYKLPVAVGNAKAPRVPVLEVVGAEVTDEPVDARDMSKPTDASSDLFLWLRVDNPRPYVGEQITYAIELYEALGRRVEISLSEMPGFQNFWVEELPGEALRVEEVAGRPYRVHSIFRRALFPQKAGALTIGRPQVDVGVVAGLIPTVQRLRRVAGKPLKIEVRPLPAEGQPVGFSPNNVGVFEIKAEVDRRKVKQGEPFTLTVDVSGTGNVAAIDPGAWPELPGMRRYDPKVETTAFSGAAVGGARRYEFLVIPERGGALEIPAHPFSFFDPKTERYQTVKTAPIAIEVEADPNAPAPAPEAKASSDEGAQGDEAGLFAPIMSPDALPRVDAADEDWWSTWLWGMVGVPAVASAAAVAAALWRRFGPDERARARAAREAQRRELLARAEQGVETGDGFYSALGQLLQGAAVDRVGPEGYGLPRRELLALLRRRGLAAEEVDRFGALLDRCDAARFGAAGRESPAARRELLEQALTLVKPGPGARRKESSRGA
ncbi:MAG: BatD family protein [Nannocystaceae bacterium]